MFTASNKAWNMDELYEAGADGYYVKEHPETAHDPEFSTKNFESFHKTVENCLEKGKLLGKYWKQIKYIEQNLIIENKLGADGELEFEKDRINERLMMFLGLLKKAFEQTKFDKNTFFYSEWELAFLTLWSTFNEIQEASFKKIPLEYIDKNGNKYLINDYHRDKLSLPSLSTWKLNLPKKYKNPKYSIFVDYDMKFSYDKDEKIQVDYKGFYEILCTRKTILLYSGNSKYGRYYSFNPKGMSDISVKLEERLHSQIAFILLNMDSSRSLLKHLKEINDFRNHLYLTHGEEPANPNYALEYKDQRYSDKDWETHIEQLFEIVYFLCTGEECTWSAK